MKSFLIIITDGLNFPVIKSGVNNKVKYNVDTDMFLMVHTCTHTRTHASSSAFEGDFFKRVDISKRYKPLIIHQ
uniref:Uncharacterized protein n=1 Tax=Anguilla anguilla TaxID=7936 RepID=A0A0E9T3D1_ANGAN